MKQGVIVLNDSKKGEVCTDGEVGAVDSNSKNVLPVLQKTATGLSSVKRHNYQPCSVFYMLQGKMKKIE